MKYLVLGAGGFIGGYLYRKLLEQKQSDDLVVGISRKSQEVYSPGSGDGLYYSELEKHQWVQRLLCDLTPDVILAFQGRATVSSEARDIWSSNVNTTFNLIDSIPKDHKVRFILASSIMANFLRSPYAASKVAAESLVSAQNWYCDNFFGTSVRFCAVAGAHNTHGAVRDIVRKFVQDDKVILFGNIPGSMKPYLYIYNLVDAILSLIDVDSDMKYRFPTVNVCPRGVFSISSIADIVRKYVGQDKAVEFNGQTWRGDIDYVISPNDYEYKKMSTVEILPTHVALELAIKDILREEYGAKI